MNTTMKTSAIFLLCTAGALAAEPLDGRQGRDLALDQFRPKTMLRVEQHLLPRAKFPVVDVHVHPRIRFHHSPEALDNFVKLMDEQNIAGCVSLDGGLGEALAEHQKYLWTKYRDRFVIFANIDWQGDGRADEPATWAMHREDFGRRMAQALSEAKRAGVSGLKVFKDFGLRYRNPDGSLVKIDDPRWEPIWTACGNLGLPILIHVGDPAAFFEPVDETNERWEELHRHPDWSFYGGDNPKREELFAAFNRVVAAHPATMFIGAHVADNPEDLATVGQWLDTYPNLNVEIASRTNELGRQPITARKFFLKHQDRIMFGTDGPRERGRLLPYWRFLETADEYFPYAENPFPPQGFWHIYGIELPDDVLRKVYQENAARVIPGVAKMLERRPAG
ncbi:MAG TPA: amidohydrolase family protein [Pirellulales bacterium]|nr:amidohydrolase family protein [Pirellulales bacterium]